MVEKDFLLNKNMLEPKSRGIISYLEEKIDNRVIKDFLINYTAGEEGIAYEFLCSEIFALKIKLPKDIFFLIKEECLQYEVEECYWKDLEKLIID